MATLHYGSESFPLPEDANIAKLVGRLTWAATGNRMIPVELDGGTIHISVGPGIPVWVDERG